MIGAVRCPEDYPWRVGAITHEVLERFIVEVRRVYFERGSLRVSSDRIDLLIAAKAEIERFLEVIVRHPATSALFADARNSISNSIVNQSSTATRRWNEPVGDPV
ncbi:hypothetical protein, partial [Caballeronia udeis]|uniref:hypothetical protein n=1 Tax=Caballeronia udeis TaxID=1232866 RepID=UPI001E5AE86A